MELVRKPILERLGLPVRTSIHVAATPFTTVSAGRAGDCFADAEGSFDAMASRNQVAEEKRRD
jgi:hypothetical protein